MKTDMGGSKEREQTEAAERTNGPREEGGRALEEAALPEQSLAPANAGMPDLPEQELLAVRLPIFEGPLDLLLHLVREHRLDIFDIPIAFITEKYLEMVERMRELNLDVAGEFLVMAATLAHIKSRMLLPRSDDEDSGEDGAEEGDPRADLVRRLLEYQKYREAAGSLGGQDILGRDVFVRDVRSEAPEPPEGDLGLRQVGVFKLIEALDSVLARAKTPVSHEVTRDRLSLSERLNELVEQLARSEKMTFFEMFEGSLDKQAIVVTFLALLEMSRLGLARITQEEPEGDILIMGTSRSADEPAEIVDDFK
ncbi:MAG: segregation and condensation protein A [Myxococcota bacterium]